MEGRVFHNLHRLRAHYMNYNHIFSRNLSILSSKNTNFYTKKVSRESNEVHINNSNNSSNDSNKKLQTKDNINVTINTENKRSELLNNLTDVKCSADRILKSRIKVTGPVSGIIFSYARVFTLYYNVI